MVDGSNAKKQGYLLPSRYFLRSYAVIDIAHMSIGQLKAKLAKLKRELLTPSSGGGGGGGTLRHTDTTSRVLMYKQWVSM